jgi:lipoprotein-releasing system permease protein
MMYELALSLRYLKSRRRQAFISLITVISTGGVAVGVMVLIVVLAVMSGFQTSLKEKLLGINSHIWVLPQLTGRLEAYENVITQLTTLPQVTLASPFTTNEVMLMSNGRVAGTIVRGVDPAQKSPVDNVSPYFHGPNLQSLLPSAAASQDPQVAPTRHIILGRDLARHLGVSHSRRDPAEYAPLHGHRHL